jgi:hypothetical protein
MSHIDCTQPLQKSKIKTARALREAASGVIGVQKGLPIDRLFKPYDRIQRHVMNHDNTVLAGRMFREQTQQTELFPSSHDANLNKQSLTKRIQGVESSVVTRIDYLHQPSYCFTSEYAAHWEPIADDMGAAMLDIFIEYTAYEVLFEAMHELKSGATLSRRLCRELPPERSARVTPRMHAHTRQEILLRKRERTHARGIGLLAPLETVPGTDILPTDTMGDKEHKER